MSLYNLPEEEEEEEEAQTLCGKVYAVDASTVCSVARKAASYLIGGRDGVRGVRAYSLEGSTYD